MSQPHLSTDGPWTDPQTHLDTDPVNAPDAESDDTSPETRGTTETRETTETTEVEAHE